MNFTSPITIKGVISNNYGFRKAIWKSVHRRRANFAKVTENVDQFVEASDTEMTDVGANILRYMVVRSHHILLS